MKEIVGVDSVLSVVCDDIAICDGCKLLTPRSYLFALVDEDSASSWWDDVVLDGDKIVRCIICIPRGRYDCYIGFIDKLNKSELIEFRELIYNNEKKEDTTTKR